MLLSHLKASPNEYTLLIADHALTRGYDYILSLLDGKELGEDNPYTKGII